MRCSTFPHETEHVVIDVRVICVQKPSPQQPSHLSIVPDGGGIDALRDDRRVERQKPVHFGQKEVQHEAGRQQEECDHRLCRIRTGQNRRTYGSQRRPACGKGDGTTKRGGYRSRPRFWASRHSAILSATTKADKPRRRDGSWAEETYSRKKAEDLFRMFAFIESADAGHGTHKRQNQSRPRADADATTRFSIRDVYGVHSIIADASF